MIALYLTGTVVLALGLYWLGVNHGRDYQTKRLAPWVDFADPALKSLSVDRADVVHITVRRVGDDWNATYLPMTEGE